MAKEKKKKDVVKVYKMIAVTPEVHYLVKIAASQDRQSIGAWIEWVARKACEAAERGKRPHL
jgi:hypothetical protein